MYEIKTYQELDMLLLEGLRAKQYACDHYEELSARTAAFTLYGPYCPGMGAGIPGSLTPKRAHELRKQTRRRDYNIYELDDEYKLIRVINMNKYSDVNTVYRCTVYHCFEFNETLVGVPFWGNDKKLLGFQNYVVRYQNGLPFYLGITSDNCLLAHFYEYISSESVKVSCYSYRPRAKKSVEGLPIDRDSPIGSPTSPVDTGEWVEDIRYTDFSQWFK